MRDFRKAVFWLISAASILFAVLILCANVAILDADISPLLEGSFEGVAIIAIGAIVIRTRQWEAGQSSAHVSKKITLGVFRISLLLIAIFLFTSLLGLL